ncbi:MAG: hypothetical protein RL417_510 [Pseudomonadota bacterium]|jgi:hypothetical protein
MYRVKIAALITSFLCCVSPALSDDSPGVSPELRRFMRPALVIGRVVFPTATCNESVFKPCVCASKTPPQVKYRPALKRCKGRAGVILEGSLRTAFSVVFRDRANRDRYAPPGWNGCTPAEVDMGLAKCSYYKAQKVYRTSQSTTFCFPFPGTSKQMAKASRLTVKLKDSPNDTKDPLVRLCLPLFKAKNPIN